jgi:hypothetical protein
MIKNRFSAFFGVNDSYTAYQFKGTGSTSVTLPTISQGPYYSWKSLGQTTTTSNSESVLFDLAKNQVGYYWYYPPGDGKITIYASSS